MFDYEVNLVTGIQGQQGENQPDGILCGLYTTVIDLTKLTRTQAETNS